MREKVMDCKAVAVESLSGGWKKVVDELGNHWIRIDVTDICTTMKVFAVESCF